MLSPHSQDIARFYTERHQLRQANRQDVFGDKPYGNFGYWAREGMSMEEAGDALTDLVARTAEIGPTDRVLEVGCGYGASAVFYTRRYQPAAVVGLDVTPVRIETAREYIAANGLADKIQVALGDATSLAFAAGSFTKVLAIECAFHFHTRRDFFREAARVLAPGGSLVLTDIVPRRGVAPAEFLARVYPIGTTAALNVPENVYDSEAYAGNLGEAGFGDIRMEVITPCTLPHFADHLDRLGRQIDGPRGAELVRHAQLQRQYLKAGLEYVLVAARKSGILE